MTTPAPFVPGDEPDQNLPEGEPTPTHPDFLPDRGARSTELPPAHAQADE